jgi:hypothetical protein
MLCNAVGSGYCAALSALPCLQAAPAPRLRRAHEVVAAETPWSLYACSSALLVTRGCRRQTAATGG